MDEVAAADHVTRTALVREGIVMVCRLRNMERDPLAELVADGRAIPATRSLEGLLAVRPLRLRGGIVNSAAILAEQRADRT